MTVKNSNQISGSQRYSLGMPRTFRRTVYILITLVFVISILDLSGWIFHITIFKSLSPGWIPMKIITAICSVFAATVLVFIQLKIPAIYKKIVPIVLSIIICLVSLLTLYVSIYSVRVGHEAPLTKVSYLAFIIAPGLRMALFTAISFFIIGCAFFLLIAEKSYAHGIAHILILPAALISYFVPVSYLIGVYSLHAFDDIPVALNTGIALCGICAAVFLIRPNTWFLKVFTSNETGSIFIRKLLFALIILPLLIGWLRIKGERAGLFESDEGVALVVITYTTSFLILIWLTAKSVNKIDASRRISEDALQRSEKHLQKAQEIAHLGSWELDIDSGRLIWSDEVYRIFGLKPQEFGATYTDFLNAIHPDDRAAVDAAYTSSLSDGKDTYEIDHRIIRKSNGEIRFVHEKCEHFRDESGKVIRSVGMVHDVTEHKMSELALRESEEKYRLLFDRMTEGFALHEIILDDKGKPCDYKFLTINPAFEKLTGLKAENIIGRKVTEVLPGTEKYWIDNYGKVAIMGESIDFENFSSDLNSYFRVSAFSPKKGYFAIIFENISSYVLTEKELRRTKDYLEKLINYANTPIIVWNPETEIQLFNHAFENLTGYSSAEVVGKKLDLLFPKTSLRESKLRIRNALTKNLETIEIPILTKKKEIRTVLWNSANIYDIDNNTVFSTIAQGNDITERINAEQNAKERTKDLEVANSLLKQELTERILAQQALRKSEAQLKELNATKDKFFNIIAHDLKNPFTSLIGSSELLFYNIDQLNHEKITQLAKILNDSAKSGYAILQNLLDWSRSQTGLLNFKPEKINLKNLVDENILNLEQFSANKEIEMHSTVKETIFIFADKNMIKTILRNLLSNAVKFSFRSGKVFVNAVEGQDKVTISVKDDGIGIPEEDIEKIFRIDANYVVPGTENEQGTGLGLKLSKEFVEKQGGKIWVESTENQGSVFKFSIPVKED